MFNKYLCPDYKCTNFKPGKKGEHCPKCGKLLINYGHRNANKLRTKKKMYQWKPKGTEVQGYINNKDIDGLIDIITEDKKSLPVKKAALIALWKSRDSKAIPGLLKALNNKDDRIRTMAATYLGYFNDISVLNGLVSALRDKNENVRHNATISLRQLNWEPQNDDDKYYFCIASSEWDKIAINENLLNKLIENALSSNDDWFRVRTVQFLSTINSDTAIHGLNEFLQDKKADIRSMAANYLEDSIEKEKIQNFKNQFKLTEDYIYIINFAKRFKNHYSTQEINKLKDLMAYKGIDIPGNGLKELIEEEVLKQDYLEFKTEITYNNPQELEEYVKNLIEIYGENYNNRLHFFELVLQENDLQYFENEVSNIVNKITKERELLLFEKELLSTTDSGESPFISIQNIDKLDGYQFEYVLKFLFEKMGYNVENTPLAGDQGADLILNRFNEKIVVQAKCYSDKVTNKAVQEVVASIAQYNANKGIVITNNEFTASAIELASANSIELINRDILVKLLNKYPISKVEL